MMNAKVKQQWIEALESGNYQHGKGKLRRNGLHNSSHCCLGVLCEVYGLTLQSNGMLPEGMGSYADIYYFTGLNAGAGRQLVAINDATDTIDYSRQIQYIKENC